MSSELVRVNRSFKRTGAPFTRVIINMEDQMLENIDQSLSFWKDHKGNRAEFIRQAVREKLEGEK